MSEKWKVTPSRLFQNDLAVKTVETDSFVCAVCAELCGNDPSEVSRRAHLIAASPEMLALLKTSRRNLSSIIAACNCNTYDPWLAEMDRVIALAEGNGGAL